MGSGSQHSLMAFALRRLNRVPYQHLLLAGLLSCVCSFPAWADERPAPKSLWQTVLTPPAADQLPTPPTKDEGAILVTTADGKGVPLVKEDAEKAGLRQERTARQSAAGHTRLCLVSRSR